MLKQYFLENKEAHYRMAYTYTKNQEDAMDVVQDSIEKALKAFKKGLRPDSLNSWFYRILINTAIDYTRRNKRIAHIEQEKLEYLITHEDTYRDFDLEMAMAQLPTRYKTIVILRYFEDMKISEIAEVLDENINTVKTRLYKSLELLKIELEEVTDEQTG